MRSTHRIQPSLPIGQIPHKHAMQLRLIAQILDGLPQLEEQVLADLVPAQVRRDVGRDGLSAQQVLRVLVLYLLLKVICPQSLYQSIRESRLSHTTGRIPLGIPS